MDEEIEDIIGDVQYTESQKSVATVSSLQYPPDFADSASVQSYKNSTKTYVIDRDTEISSESMNATSCDIRGSPNRILESEVPCFEPNRFALAANPGELELAVTQCVSTSCNPCTIVAQETYTQTSRTIFELADADRNENPQYNTLETQTSLVSITENKTLSFTFHLNRATQNSAEFYNQTIEKSNSIMLEEAQSSFAYNRFLPTIANYECGVSDCSYLHPLEDRSSKRHNSATDNDTTENSISDSLISSGSESDHIIQIINDMPPIGKDQAIHCNTSISGDSNVSDIEKDSLMGDLPEFNNKEIENLHVKLCNNEEYLTGERYAGPDISRFGILTPLTEETNVKRTSNISDVSPRKISFDDDCTEHDDLTFTSSLARRENSNISEVSRKMIIFSENIDQNDVLVTNSGFKAKAVKDDIPTLGFKLPPIRNNSCPSSPHLNSLFSKPKLIKAGTLPSVHEAQKPVQKDSWELATQMFASGENARITELYESLTNVQLPPISHGETTVSSKASTKYNIMQTSSASTTAASDKRDNINIKDKIRELTTPSYDSKPSKISNYRSESPSVRRSTVPTETRELMERGCEVVVTDLLRKMRSGTWSEVIDALESLPKDLDKFWDVITEVRIADLLRQVNSLIESPRTQVTKAACDTAAVILENTNFTKKPDFNEVVSTLLIKTGSYCRVVRRAANLALDHIVCGVDMTPVVSALCVHGVGHKNSLVRSAATRLLVVCCALSGGGCELLRSRPPTAAHARKQVLCALSMLLTDKNNDTRKYAERLYTMLRPLPSFEAYYLTDVNVDLASKQMKKYDEMLLIPAKEDR